MLSFELELPHRELEDLLNSASQLPMTVMEQVGERLEQEAESLVDIYLAEYPPERAEGDFVDWLSEKQRKTVMAKLREMGMDDGYERTHTLWDSWWVDVSVDGEERHSGIKRLLRRVFRRAAETDYKMSVTLRNDAMDPFGTEYARFVHDEEWQQPFHRDQGWQTDQTVGQAIAQRAMDHLEKLVDDALS